ncbi:MAG: Lrp/AsnC family transcriptional regulator [Planctomycetes bacterium]|nr:Lrp/AsnC family transcriptional regulator [Planctomycetota bacterium]
MFDHVDHTILSTLQRDARIANAEIARQLDMAPSAILERIRKLEQRGVIRGYEARVDPRAAGVGLTAFVFVRGSFSAPGAAALGEALSAVPEVAELHQVAGEDCWLLKVRVEDTDALARLLNEGIKPLPGVEATRTTIVLATRKETGTVALRAAASGGHGRNGR